jgi:hypothetical protein
MAYVSYLDRSCRVRQLFQGGPHTQSHLCAAGLHVTQHKKRVFSANDNPPKVNNLMATHGKFDLTDKAAMDAIAPPSECPAGSVSQTFKFRRGARNIPVVTTA